MNNKSFISSTGHWISRNFEQKHYVLSIRGSHTDGQTRWNSTYYLLERIIEQRRAINLLATEVDAVPSLTQSVGFVGKAFTAFTTN
ncbi:unnamed protein product [Acanthoscelides obtectus]|uniref:Uncharacterized protein n=1 Tax=Acanthoscelides obtectus TaxID=200917 RepID=A0A9P0M187_ACAOB|nr:unnamed protein product [Acanthoscelides obtectus]CAK1657425.1 hypothetical protein AOBTE_LOCUS20338 [Acanthoscelides obtectus]